MGEISQNPETNYQISFHKLIDALSLSCYCPARDGSDGTSFTKHYDPSPFYRSDRARGSRACVSSGSKNHERFFFRLSRVDHG